MKRVVSIAVVVYLILALRGLANERFGARTCACRADCWCKRPGLSLFRWVFPIGHRAADALAS
jgi:hypothetical protein